MSTHFISSLNISRFGSGRKNNDRKVFKAWVASYFYQAFQTIFIRHFQIKENNIGPVILQQLQKFFTISNKLYLYGGIDLLQSDLKNILIVDVVFGQNDIRYCFS